MKHIKSYENTIEDVHAKVGDYIILIIPDKLIYDEEWKYFLQNTIGKITKIIKNDILIEYNPNDVSPTIKQYLKNYTRLLYYNPNITIITAPTIKELKININLLKYNL